MREKKKHLYVDNQERTIYHLSNSKPLHSQNQHITALYKISTTPNRCTLAALNDFTPILNLDNPDNQGAESFSAVRGGLLILRDCS